MLHQFSVAITFYILYNLLHLFSKTVRREFPLELEHVLASTNDVRLYSLRFEDSLGELEVFGNAGIDVHAQSAKHDCDNTRLISCLSKCRVYWCLPASARASDEIKVVAWLGRILWFHFLHEIPEDDEARKPTNATSIYSNELTKRKTRCDQRYLERGASVAKDLPKLLVDSRPS